MIPYALIFAFTCFGIGQLFCLYRVVFAPGVADRVLALDTMAINMIALISLFRTAFAEFALIMLIRTKFLRRRYIVLTCLA